MTTNFTNSIPAKRTPTRWITAVDHDQETGAISHVCLTVGPSLDGPTQRLARKELVEWLAFHEVVTGAPYHVIHTAFVDEGEWKPGARVRLTPDRKYITTTPTSTARDNLGALPECYC